MRDIIRGQSGNSLKKKKLYSGGKNNRMNNHFSASYNLTNMAQNKSTVRLTIEIEPDLSK